MESKKRNMASWAMDNAAIVILIASCLVAFGIYSLRTIKKNEFPDFTIRQGLVIAAYPGVTAAEMEEQVTKPLEGYIFSYKEVNKEKTRSYSRDGLSIVQVELNEDINLESKDAFWSRFKLGAQSFKSSLPQGVLALMVKDDFGDTSALLITLESSDKTYEELESYMDDLQESLREIESIGRMTVYGMVRPEIAVYLDNDRLSRFALSDKTLAMELMGKGLVTTGGTVKMKDAEAPIHLSRSYNALSDVEEMVVLSDRNGGTVRLKDIADVRWEYPAGAAHITNNGVKCLLLSVEIKKGRSITDMGSDIYKKLDSFEKDLPDDVKIFRITDQAKVVSDSVAEFLLELLIAIAAVMIVVLLLMPMRVALVAASTIPISIFIALGIFNAVGLELNTVTLAALIVTLGMIVDNSIVIIDSYVEMIQEGEEPRKAALQSAVHFFKPILTATLAISVTFFPLIVKMTGNMLDFLKSFPWAISIVLLVSLLVAELIVPLMQYKFITKDYIDLKYKSRSKSSFLDILQNGYNRLIGWCFRHKWIVIGIGVACIAAGIFLMGRLPSQLMPAAQRNQFAVEISLPMGTPLEKTAAIADSLESFLSKDERVVSIASFKGMSSPRFHTAYAPQIAGSEYAQFVVNTTGPDATVAVLEEYRMKYANYFPEANVNFKQLSYGGLDNPVEVKISGKDWNLVKETASKVEDKMKEMPEFMLVKSNTGDPLLGARIDLDEEKASRLGLGNAALELTMALRYSDGISVGSVWNGDKEIPVKIKGLRSARADFEDVSGELIPVHAGLASVPLREIATVEPEWNDGQICHLNGIRTITVMCEVTNGVNVMAATEKLQEKLEDVEIPEGIALSFGGEIDQSGDTVPKIIASLSISVLIIFFLLLFHYKDFRIVILLMVSLALCLFGTAVGVLVQGVNFSITCYLGIISLMGILVRNAIIMYDYARELQENEGLSHDEAIKVSAERRMRPIFLTSAAASMGVIPMIIGGSTLWMPMGAVICYGTLLTMLLILTVLPVAYSLWGGKAR